MNKIGLLLAGVLLLSLNVAAQNKKQKETQATEVERQTSDARSFIELFTKLERNLMDAVQKKDREAIDATLAPEFTVRSSVDPEHPVSRIEWMQDTLTKDDVRSHRIRSVTIRAFLSVAVVSFIESEEAPTQGKKSRSDQLIVDIWETIHGKWQPALRFISPLAK